MIRTRALAAAAGAAIIAAGGAHAAGPDHDHARKNEPTGFIIEMHEDTPPAPRAGSGSGTWIERIERDGRVIEVRRGGGRTLVMVDGERVDRDRYTVTDHGRVIVFDASGETLHEFGVGGPEVARVVVAADRSAPKVMLGITLDEAPESLREHLGIGVDAIIVERVVEGLSADKSGMERGDVIVSIDGSEGVGPESLRKILSKFAPGDVALVKVIRRGKPVTLPITLQRYDAGRLGVRAPEPPEPPRFNQRGGDAKSMGAHGRKLRAEAHERIVDALREHGVEGDALNEISAEARSALKVLEEGVRSFKERGNPSFPDWTRRGDSDDGMALEIRRKAEQAIKDARRQMLELRDGRLLLREHAEELEREFDKNREKLESKGSALARELDDRMETYEDRLGDLEDRIDGIVDSIGDRLEDFADRVMERLDELDDD